MQQAPPVSPDPLSPLADKTSGMAITSLILGIVGLLTTIFGIGLLLAIAGLVLGIIALATIGKPGKPSRGKGLAIGGVVTSALCVTLLPVALLIGILLPAVGAARTTAQQMASNTQARGIQQAMIIQSQGQTPNANGDIPLTDDLGELLLGNYFAADYTQSPMDKVGGDLPTDFYAWTPEVQADWVRANADFVIVPGLVDDLDTSKIALFGKPDRFDGRGIPVTRNDNSTAWETDVLRIEQELQAQTGKTMAELILDAEAMTGQP